MDFSGSGNDVPGRGDQAMAILQRVARVSCWC
jgi:hypothetical protein